MVILLIKDSNELIRNISRDLYGSSGLERPVILKDLEAYPDYPVGFFLGICRIQLEKLS